MILKLRPFSKNLDSHMNHSNNSSPLSQWPTEKSNLKSEVFNYLLYYRDQRLIAEFVVLRPHGSQSAQRIIRTKSFLKRVFSIFFADLHIKPAAFALQVNSVMISQSESQFSQWKWNPLRNYSQLCLVNSFSVWNLFSIDRKQFHFRVCCRENCVSGLCWISVKGRLGTSGFNLPRWMKHKAFYYCWETLSVFCVIVQKWHCVRGFNFSVNSSFSEWYFFFH